MKRLGLTAIMGALVASACGSNTGGTQQPPPVTITFQLHNDGISTVYLFQNCLLDYTITSLADPVHEIPRGGACACTCGRACPVCGPCFAGPRELAIGAMMIDTWNTVSVTTETTATGSCERSTTLPDGSYRIDVPVYPTDQDALAKTYARTATQSFELPVLGNVVHVQLGASP